ncbi:MAG: hypothetical protein FGM15_00210 [Chthoniobacterales bacterium]|nr:hypothetical protein [Chthoniobacterales bacterium]
MNTRQRALSLAIAAEPFRALLGSTTADDLLAWVRAELGDVNALDAWVPHGDGKTKAVAPCTILHVVSGNTPHAALQSLVGGLLLGSRNLLKLPRGGLIEVDEFVSRLPDALGGQVEPREDLPGEWMERADAVIVFGMDETVATIRSRLAADKIFIGYGHKVSLGIIWHDPALSSCADAARDASLFDQQGCLSPVVFYVREPEPGFARAYAGGLAAAMEQFNRTHPRGALGAGEKAAIADLRAAYRFRAVADPSVAIWEGGANLDWTVVLDNDTGFPASPLNRVIFVRPLPDDLAAALGPAAAHLGAVGLYPCTEDTVRRFPALRPSRFCPVGRMQLPPWTWHNGGVGRLASLVKWVDFEPSSGFTG